MKELFQQWRKKSKRIRRKVTADLCIFSTGHDISAYYLFYLQYFILECFTTDNFRSILVDFIKRRSIIGIWHLLNYCNLLGIFKVYWYLLFQCPHHSASINVFHKHSGYILYALNQHNVKHVHNSVQSQCLDAKLNISSVSKTLH